MAFFTLKKIKMFTWICWHFTYKEVRSKSWKKSNSLVSHTICRRKTASALAAVYNPISFHSLEWHRLPRKHEEMRTGGESPLRTLCFRQQNSHNPVFLTSRDSDQKNLHLLDCSFPMSKSCSQLPWLITGSISCICFFSGHIHLCQHLSR